MIDNIINDINTLEKSWDITKFPEQSVKILQNLNCHLSFEEFEAEVAMWLSKTKKLPTQVNLYNSFGEPPVTIFNNNKFAVDIYFWRKNNTLIHSHAFRGAFKVLYGQSLHEQFQVEVLEPIDDDILLSKLKNSQKIIMKAGASQVINPGMELVHRVVHLDNPTVSLCIRTVNDVELAQWHHLPSGISYQKHNLTEETIKKISFFEFMYNSDSNKALEFLGHLLSGMTTSAQLDLCESLLTNELGLSEDITSIALNEIQKIFTNKKWYQNYSEHFNQMAKNLDEYQLSSAGTKLLAHAINSNYSAVETKNLLSEVTTKNVDELTQALLTGPPIFCDDYYELQIKKVKNYFN